MYSSPTKPAISHALSGDVSDVHISHALSGDVSDVHDDVDGKSGSDEPDDSDHRNGLPFYELPTKVCPLWDIYAERRSALLVEGAQNCPP